MRRILLIFAVFLLFLGVFSYFSCFIDHESASFEQVSFAIDSPYLGVVKNLSKKDSLEHIIEESDAKLNEKSWESFDVDIPNRLLRLREYKINGVLRFIVEKNDNFLGNLVIPFKQVINFDKNMLKVEINLDGEQKKIIFYKKIIKITPIADENKTFFEISSKLTIKNRIFFFFKDFMDKKVVESNKKDLLQLENNLKNIVNKPIYINLKGIKMKKILLVFCVCLTVVGCSSKNCSCLNENCGEKCKLQCEDNRCTPGEKCCEKCICDNFKKL